VSESTLSTKIKLLLARYIESGDNPEAVAAYGIAFRLDSIAIMPVIGMMTAIMTIVGQNIGAKKIDRAHKVTFNASLMAVGYTLFIGTMFFLFSIPLSKIFSNNASVIFYASRYLLINSPVYMFAAISMVIMGSFLGAGKSIQPMIINILRLIVVAVPLAYILSLSFGIVGIWIGIAISSVVAGIVSIAWFKVSGFS